jgi:hypothetical protein
VTKFYASIALVALLVMGALGYLYYAPKKGETEQAVCVLLVDRTGSSMSDQTRSSYERMAGGAIEGCTELQASLSVFYFDNQSAKILQAQGDQPFNLFRPMARRKKVGEDQQEAIQKDAAEAVASVFETEPESSLGGHGSDIITAVGQAASNLQSLATRHGVDKKYLVVLTDGQQTGAELGMHRTFKDPSVPSSVLVKKTTDVGLTPDLTGVQTSFVGVAGGVADSRRPAWYTARVHGFWTELVELGGGQMCVYGVEQVELPGSC